MSFREQKREEEKIVDEKNFDLDELAEILALVEKYNLSDFEVERGGDKLKLSRGGQKELREIAPSNSYLQHQPYQLTQPQVIPFVREEINPQSQTTGGSSNQAHQTTSSLQAVSQTATKPQKDISSPMVGTFYRRPAVDAEPYVNVGDVVKKGDVLCIIEAMKLMNEIESEVSGKIVEVCLEDGQMAEYGEVLFRVEPS